MANVEEVKAHVVASMDGAGRAATGIQQAARKARYTLIFKV